MGCLRDFNVVEASWGGGGYRRKVYHQELRRWESCGLLGEKDNDAVYLERCQPMMKTTIMTNGIQWLQQRKAYRRPAPFRVLLQTLPPRLLHRDVWHIHWHLCPLGPSSFFLGTGGKNVVRSSSAYSIISCTEDVYIQAAAATCYSTSLWHLTPVWSQWRVGKALVELTKGSWTGFRGA